MKIAILILAAGSSSRMKQPKQLLPFGNSNLLGYVIENVIQSKADGFYCVLGAHYNLIKKSIKRYNINVIFNENSKLGLSTSIVKGVESLDDYDAILICLADQPNIKTEYFDTLISSFKNNPNKIIASIYDKKVGVPAVFPKVFFKELKKLTGDKGAKKILELRKNDCIFLGGEDLIDIDTKEDYDILKKNRD